MDSGNSSSMQSSSGGCGGDQEEYDSRADQSISALFNTTTVSSNIAVPTQLDSLIANYLNTSWSTENPLWSALSSTTKPNDGARESRLQPQISSEPVFFTNTLQQNLVTVSNHTNTTSPICLVPTDKKNGLNNMTTTRNPKKRSRVSRKAPTTVLTTDTSNFRAMVQEFTGNPSTPFTGLSSSPFSRSRFDLFGSSSSSSSLRPLTNHHHHQSLLLNMNTQNPFLNNYAPNEALMNQSILSEKSKPLSLGTSNDFGKVEVGTSFEGFHDIIVSSSSSMTQLPTLNMIHGDKNTEAENVSHLLRSINGEESTVQGE